uniref:Uncharacterized protein n=1 Tax=Arundo donax TaxID=35708 RepID=A0A0A9AK28_ARUDO
MVRTLGCIYGRKNYKSNKSTKNNSHYYFGDSQHPRIETFHKFTHFPDTGTTSQQSR